LYCILLILNKLQKIEETNLISFEEQTYRNEELFPTCVEFIPHPKNRPAVKVLAKEEMGRDSYLRNAFLVFTKPGDLVLYLFKDFNHRETNRFRYFTPFFGTFRLNP